MQTIAEEARTVRLPLNKVNLLKDISKAVKRFHQESDRDPEVEELAEELDLPIQEILDTLRAGAPDLRNGPWPNSGTHHAIRPLRPW